MREFIPFLWVFVQNWIQSSNLSSNSLNMISQSNALVITSQGLSYHRFYLSIYRKAWNWSNGLILSIILIFIGFIPALLPKYSTRFMQKLFLFTVLLSLYCIIYIYINFLLFDIFSSFCSYWFLFFFLFFFLGFSKLGNWCELSFTSFDKHKRLFPIQLLHPLFFFKARQKR